MEGYQFWAVEAKELQKVVCFINFNSMDEAQTLDIGHITNSEYLNDGYDYEALKALYNYGFLQLGAERIIAHWALHDKEKLAPLIKLGMKITETNIGNKFRPNPEGIVEQFEGCTLTITREEWITNPAI
jgi:RimJ/RimL family protein N-acetyltransferase